MRLREFQLKDERTMNHSTYRNITCEKFCQEDPKEYVLLDVRTKVELLLSGKMKNAVNIDINKKNFVEEVRKQISPGKKVLIYCRSGKRSLLAAQLMDRVGEWELFNLEGGWLAWIAYLRKVRK